MAAIGQPRESGAAMRANESIGPPSTCQVSPARLFGGELISELKKVPRESCDLILHEWMSLNSASIPILLDLSA